jgi:fructose-1,6-bisphosphatase/inositol monophosphatase family enzyme
MTFPFFDVIKESLGQKYLADILALRATKTQKPDGSYVTQGDLLAQKVILEAANEAFVNPFIVSEEISLNETEPAPEQMVIVIDPIDGTENFTSGLMEWGVSISCYQNGRHVASLLGLPEMNLWLQSGDTLTRHQSRIRALSSSLSKEQIIASTTGYEYRIIGCCVCNMFNVIRGSFFSFENPKGAQSWDILAGLNLALEQNLNVTVEGKTYAGEYLSAHQKYRFKIEQR